MQPGAVHRAHLPLLKAFCANRALGRSLLLHSLLYWNKKKNTMTALGRGSSLKKKKNFFWPASRRLGRKTDHGHAWLGAGCRGSSLKKRKNKNQILFFIFWPTQPNPHKTPPCSTMDWHARSGDRITGPPPATKPCGAPLPRGAKPGGRAGRSPQTNGVGTLFAPRPPQNPRRADG